VAVIEKGADMRQQKRGLIENARECPADEKGNMIHQNAKKPWSTPHCKRFKTKGTEGKTGFPTESTAGPGSIFGPS
jgi:hypothetical protein